MELEVIKEIFQKVFVREIIAQAYYRIKNHYAYYRVDSEFSQEDLYEAFELIAIDALNWSATVSTIGPSNSMLLEDRFVNLSYYVNPVKESQSTPIIKPSLLTEIIDSSNQHLILFGKPGMGKSTTMKMISRKLILDEDFANKYFPIPIIIRLREISDFFSQEALGKNSSILLFLRLQEILQLRLYKNDIKDLNEIVLRKAIYKVLNDFKLIIILDGYDELDIQLRTKIMSQVRDISLKTSKTKFIITSRTGEFKYKYENFNYFEIAPLNDIQIEQFVKGYIKNVSKSDELILQIKNSTFYDTAMRPLILSFLCTIFLVDGELPSKPKFIYQEIIDILINKWNRMSGVTRVSSFSKFNKNEKVEFIATLAFELIKQSKIHFSKEDLRQIYFTIYSRFDLPSSKSQEVVDEIEEHSGLFFQSGIDKYEFPHKSIQEYLASYYLVRYSPLSDYSDSLVNLPHELALVISLSTNPTNKFIEILNLLEAHPDFLDFFIILVSRLELENPPFEIKNKTIVNICNIWSNNSLYNNVKNYKSFCKILKLRGFLKGFINLQASYNCNPRIVHDLMKGDSPPTDNGVVKIFEKNSSSDQYISCYYGLIKEWNTLHTYNRKD